MHVYSVYQVVYLSFLAYVVSFTVLYICLFPLKTERKRKLQFKFQVQRKNVLLCVTVCSIMYIVTYPILQWVHTHEWVELGRYINSNSLACYFVFSSCSRFTCSFFLFAKYFQPFLREITQQKILALKKPTYKTEYSRTFHNNNILPFLFLYKKNVEFLNNFFY